MILDCPACHARFKVPDAQIPEGGRVVRCGRCAHEWHCELPRETAVRDEFPPVFPADELIAVARTEAELVPAASVAEEPEVDEAFLKRLEEMMGDGAPVVTTTKTSPKIAPTKKQHHFSATPYKWAAGVIAAVWLVLAFITYAPKWANLPVLSGIYQALGATPTDGLLFADVTMEREQIEGKTRFILSGSVRNHANAARKVPVVRVSLRDKNNKAIWGREYPVNTELKAGEVYPFRITNVETSFANSVTSIVVDMGNSLQLMVR